MRAWVLLVFSDDQGTAWEALTHAIRTGEHAFRHIFGADMWTRLAERPEAARLFDEAMQSLTQGVNGPLTTNYPFEQSQLVAGGGRLEASGTAGEIDIEFSLVLPQLDHT